MTSDSNAHDAAANESLPELARKLADALEQPTTLKVGEFASILERLHGELVMMKDHQAALVEHKDEDLDWQELFGGAAAAEEADPAQVEALAEILVSE